MSSKRLPNRSESLRYGLQLRLGLVLLVLLSVDALACYYTALHFANLVYDRWLADSNRSLATAVHVRDGRMVFDLPRAALDLFQFDEVDTTYYRIDSATQGLLAGEPRLQPLGHIPDSRVVLGNSSIGGRAVRIVSSRLTAANGADAVTISVAETLVKRSTLTREIVLAMIAPQIALLGVGLGLAWLNVSRGLKPLTDLASALESRDHGNLTPVSEAGLPREARALVARLNELFARVSTAIQSQDRFVADAAHQLRTPLAAVVLHADAAERAADQDSQRRELRSLRVSADRAARMSQQLLLLQRAGTSAGSAVPLTDLDLNALVRQVGELWVPQMLSAHVDFGLQVPDSQVLVRASEPLLGEMLSNLLDNAQRYGRRDDRGDSRITLGVLSTPPTLYVEDDGPGVSPGERQQIFERFYRPPGSPGEGAGLGLAIVREIADLHHAVVRIDSDPQVDGKGGGTRFSVVFAAR